MKKITILPKQSLSGNRIITLGLVAILLIASIIAPACSSAKSSTGTKAGNQAPEFSLVDLDGNQVRLSDLRGTVVFLNFWASWCPSCRAEMPALEAVYQKYKDQNVKVIGIDYRETGSAVRQFAQDNNYNLTFVMDKAGSVAYKYEIIAFPTSFFIDTTGVIRAINVGPMSMGSMEYYLALARQ